MNTILEWLAVQSHRGYLYRLAGVVGVLAVGAHWLTAGDASNALLILGTLLGVGGNGLASVHAPVKSKRRRQAGNVDVLLLLSVLTFVGVLLLLFRVHF